MGGAILLLLFGQGEVIQPPSVPGIEYTMSGERLHYSLSAAPIQYRLNADRLHYKLEEEHK